MISAIALKKVSQQSFKPIGLHFFEGGGKFCIYSKIKRHWSLAPYPLLTRAPFPSVLTYDFLKRPSMREAAPRRVFSVPSRGRSPRCRGGRTTAVPRPPSPAQPPASSPSVDAAASGPGEGAAGWTFGSTATFGARSDEQDVAEIRADRVRSPVLAFSLCFRPCFVQAEEVYLCLRRWAYKNKSKVCDKGEIFLLLETAVAGSSRFYSASSQGSPWIYSL